VILCAEFGHTINTKVIDIFNTFLESIYLLILVGQSGRYEFVKIAISLFVSFIVSVQNLF
jgi:hypothetical protein